MHTVDTYPSLCVVYVVVWVIVIGYLASLGARLRAAERAVAEKGSK